LGALDREPHRLSVREHALAIGVLVVVGEPERTLIAAGHAYVPHRPLAAPAIQKIHALIGHRLVVLIRREMLEAVRPVAKVVSLSNTRHSRDPLILKSCGNLRKPRG